jgi:hypothetical protein
MRFRRALDRRNVIEALAGRLTAPSGLSDAGRHLWDRTLAIPRQAGRSTHALHLLGEAAHIADRIAELEG